ncbi:MAG: thymidine phosphorylase [Planctomycetota bacterium]|nr:thymidine phosphorylase [Planctomycetota bacterium]MDA1113545.1 thymidine phosphorylase [Planctomycetota bacterium]
MIDLWLAERRDGTPQAEEAIRGFVAGVVDGSITDAQRGAWLAFVMVNGMTAEETVFLTTAMTESGNCLSWDGLSGPFVDKHSTGGVGDKVSLILAPLWAFLGKKVPMLSGRGLGITGGTLDKLESIPGYRTDLELPQLRSALEEVGCFINGQTPDLAPADRILYATRNETQTVPSIPLITASILSKKLVEGIDRLVLDVKFGSGAFMQTRPDAEALANSLTQVGNAAGVQTSAVLTPMSEPLGRAVGNAVEVEESMATLQGNGPKDLVDLVVELSGEGNAARDALDSGSVFPVWQSMLRAHGGDPEAPLRGGPVKEIVVTAPHSGMIQQCDAGQIGRAVFVLGAGRRRAQDPVHFGVGLHLHAKVGDTVEEGQPLCRILHAEKGLDEARRLVEQAYRIG